MVLFRGLGFYFERLQNTLLRSNANNHQLQLFSRRAAKGMDLIQKHWHRVALPNRYLFPIYFRLTLAVQDIVDFLDTGMPMTSLADSGRQEQMIHVPPVGCENARILVPRRAAPTTCLAAAGPFERLQLFVILASSYVCIYDAIVGNRRSLISFERTSDHLVPMTTSSRELRLRQRWTD